MNKANKEKKDWLCTWCRNEFGFGWQSKAKEKRGARTFFSVCVKQMNMKMNEISCFLKDWGEDFATTDRLRWKIRWTVEEKVTNRF